MLSTDKYAYISGLRNIDAAEKLFFSLLTVVVCLWLDTPAVSLAVILFVSWLAVKKGDTPASFLLKVMTVPVSFVLLSALVLSVHVSRQPANYLWSFQFWGLWAGVTRAGAMQSMALVLRVWASVACLAFLSLTTPFIELLSALRRLGCPKLLLELTSLVYRVIFVFLDAARRIYTAQDSRLGYAGVATGFRSLGLLVSVLFLKTWTHADRLYTALEARGYNDELPVLEEPRPRNIKHYGFALMFNVFLILLAFLVR